MNIVLQLILLLDLYGCGGGRGQSQHKRVEKWGTEGTAGCRRNQTGTVQEWRESNAPFPCSEDCQSGEARVLWKVLSTAAWRKWQPVFPFTYITFQQCPKYPKDPNTLLVRPRYSGSKSNHECLFTALQKTIDKKPKLLVTKSVISIFSDPVISLYQNIIQTDLGQIYKIIYF